MILRPASTVWLLTGFLDLHFNVAMPGADQTEAFAQFINQRMEFNKLQSAYESAISAAV